MTFVEHLSVNINKLNFFPPAGKKNLLISTDGFCMARSFLVLNPIFLLGIFNLSLDVYFVPVGVFVRLFLVRFGVITSTLIQRCLTILLLNDMQLNKTLTSLKGHMPCALALSA